MSWKLKMELFLMQERGSIYRFINHSCEPNCTVEMWTVNRRIRVGVFSSKHIPLGTELTFDYAWDFREELSQNVFVAPNRAVDT